MFYPHISAALNIFRYSFTIIREIFVLVKKQTLINVFSPAIEYSYKIDSVIASIYAWSLYSSLGTLGKWTGYKWYMH